MRLPAGYLVDLVWNLTNVHRSSLVSEGAQTQLSVLASSASEESANVIYESRMLRAAVDLLYIGPVVVLEIDQSWTKDDSHTTGASVSASALSIVVVSPAVDVSRSAEHHRVHISTFDVHWTLVQQHFDQYR